MRKEIIDIASELIRFKTLASDQSACDRCFNHIADFFKNAGIAFSVYECEGVKSLLVRPAEGAVKVCLHGHYDVVDAEPEQFEPAVRGDVLYGRGAADMKTSLAGLMLLTRELYERRLPVALMVTGDEETGGFCGAGYILRQKFKCEFALSAEASGLCVINQAKGSLRLSLTAAGRAGHAAWPWQADNAILNMFAQFPNIWEVFGDPEPGAWKNTISPTVINAGDAINRIPDRCTMQVDIRHLPAEFPEEIIIRMKNAAPGIEIRELHRLEAYYCDPFNPYVERLRQAGAAVTGREPEMLKNHATSDAHHFHANQIPAVEFGPAGTGIHGAAECVDLNQVEAFYQILKKWLSDLPC